MYIYLKPTAVTEEVGLSDPVRESLMTSGGCLARLNLVARTTERYMYMYINLAIIQCTCICVHVHEIIMYI